jgi:hypothetical protein
MKSWKLRDKFSLQEIKTALEPAGEGDESGQEVSAFRTFPCHGAISAHGVEVFNQPTDQQDCFHWLDPNHEPEITCLTVKDQSLSPRFNQGGLMIVREAETMTSGKTYLLEVLNDHGQLQIKAMTLNDELLEPLLPEESPVAASELVIKRRFELLKYAELFCAPPQA